MSTDNSFGVPEDSPFPYPPFLVELAGTDPVRGAFAAAICTPGAVAALIVELKREAPEERTLFYWGTYLQYGLTALHVALGYEDSVGHVFSDLHQQPVEFGTATYAPSFTEGVYRWGKKAAGFFLYQVAHHPDSLDHLIDQEFMRAAVGAFDLIDFTRVLTGIEMEGRKLRLDGVVSLPADANAHQIKLFPLGDLKDDPELREAIIKLQTDRCDDNTDAEILREITGESVGDDPKARGLASRIRRARQLGKTTLPARG